MVKALYRTAAWRLVRRQVLVRDGHLCQIRLPGCTTVADSVDHRIEVDDGGAWYDPANLQAACKRLASGATRRSGISRSRAELEGMRLRSPNRRGVGARTGLRPVGPDTGQAESGDFSVRPGVGPAESNFPPWLRMSDLERWCVMMCDDEVREAIAALTDEQIHDLLERAAGSVEAFGVVGVMMTEDGARAALIRNELANESQRRAFADAESVARLLDHERDDEPDDVG